MTWLQVFLGTFISLAVVFSVSACRAETVTFSDTFNTFDTAKWTLYGGSTINVNQTAPGAVYIDGANDFSPATRLTHQMSTGAGNFEFRFDIVHTGDSGGAGGAFRVGWCVENDFALVQNHTDYQPITQWQYGTNVEVAF